MSSNRLNGLNDGLTHLNRIGLTLSPYRNAIGRLTIVTVKALCLFRLIDNAGNIFEHHGL